MAEKSGFFNARETEGGIYDREYDAEQFAEYFANFISNGVYVNPANQLKVVFNNSPDKPFVVVVRKGKAYIDGYWYELTEDMEVTIPANTESYAIKDVICCTLDKTERKVSIILKEGVTNDVPVNNNTQHDLVLSTILVQPNASKLNAEDITDKRPDKTYCGFVTGVIDQIDTTELFQQYDDAFRTFFNEMKDQLSTDAAGNLQTQIGLLSNLKTIVKDSIVNAINSLYDSIIGKTLKTLEEVSSNTEQGYYVDALAVAELNRKFVFNRQGVDEAGICTPHYIMILGTRVLQEAEADYRQLFSASELLSKLKFYDTSISKFDANRCVITTNNGDANTADIRFYAPEWWGSNNAYYQYFFPKTSSTIRANYCIYYFKS